MKSQHQKTRKASQTETFHLERTFDNHVSVSGSDPAYDCRRQIEQESRRNDRSLDWRNYLHKGKKCNVMRPVVFMKPLRKKRGPNPGNNHPEESHRRISEMNPLEKQRGTNFDAVDKWLEDF